MSTLVFKRTVSVKAFLAETGYKRIEVITNPNTSKRFLSCPEVPDFRGSCTCTDDDFKAGEDAIAMSLVTGDTGEFWMMHKKSSENIVALFGA